MKKVARSAVLVEGRTTFWPRRLAVTIEKSAAHEKSGWWAGVWGASFRYGGGRKKSVPHFPPIYFVLL